MYDISPPAVYAHESVMDNPLYLQRVERVVAALKRPVPITPYTDADLPRLIRDEGLLANRHSMNTLAEVRDPILLFNTFRFDGPEAAKARRQALVEAGLEHPPHSLMGTGAFIWFDANLPSDPSRAQKVCRPCWRIHLQEGCLHRCGYCGLGGLLVAMVNVEDYCHHLDEIIRRHPWQTTYLLDDDADPPGLEPELGVLGPLIEHFGTLQERYLIIHTKTWNTQWLRDLDHRGNTIVVWSLSGPTQSQLIEPNTGTTDQRIEAARVAQAAGYPVRYKFKPIIPVKSWREDAAYAVKRLFERTTPDVISLCVFMWNSFDDLLKKVPAELLDETFLEAARAHTGEPVRTDPFPHAVRKAIYEHYLAEIRKHNAEIPVSLSTESFEMWNDLKDALGCTATNYVCGCGPQCNPGLKTLTDHPFSVAVPNVDSQSRGVAMRGGFKIE